VSVTASSAQKTLTIVCRTSTRQCGIVCHRLMELSEVARYVSSSALVVSCILHLGVVQSAGGLFNACNVFGFFGLSAAKAKSITGEIMEQGQEQKDMIALAYTSMRGECAQFIGMGSASLYSLMFLHPGTSQVAVVHFAQTCWAGIALVVNSQCAGLLAPFLPPAPEYDPVSRTKLRPFVIMVGVQGILYASAFFLSKKQQKSL